MFFSIKKIIGFVVIVGIIAVIITLFFKTERGRLIINHFKIKTTEQIDEQLDNLELFTMMRQEEIKYVEKEIVKLRSEQLKLEQYKEAGVVDLEPILKEIKLLDRKRIWWEYILTFALGLLSSYIAGLLASKPN